MPIYFLSSKGEILDNAHPMLSGIGDNDFCDFLITGGAK